MGRSERASIPSTTNKADIQTLTDSGHRDSVGACQLLRWAGLPVSYCLKLPMYLHLRQWRFTQLVSCFSHQISFVSWKWAKVYCNCQEVTSRVRLCANYRFGTEHAKLTKLWIRDDFILECDCMQPATLKQTAAFRVPYKPCKDNIFKTQRKNLQKGKHDPLCLDASFTLSTVRSFSQTFKRVT